MMRMLAKLPAFESTLVPRWGFRASLAQDLPSGIILWNKRVDHYEERADEVVIYFKDGTQATADLLVGAGKPLAPLTLTFPQTESAQRCAPSACLRCK